MSGSAAVVRLFRRIIDGLILFAGLLFTLYHFGVNPTAALAGLGVGGIAVALAAQKTLENGIGGLSLIMDGAVTLGDYLKVTGAEGTVSGIGLRSTRLRTTDRTEVSVPNGQIANATLENMSVRDKFWFHHILGVRYETTAAQMRLILEKLTQLLAHYPRVEDTSIRVRFLRLGTSSLDIEIFAYLLARDYNHFLEMQEELLLGSMDAVQKAGAQLALPSQSLYVVRPGGSNGSTKPPGQDPISRTQPVSIGE